jgi:hypothetical protein
MHRREAIFDQLEAEPVDRESWSVYADLLLERDDPWAEGVARALEGRSSVARLQAARERRDPAYWPPELLDWNYTPTLTWRMGLWRELDLLLDGLDEIRVEALAGIVAHPAARLLYRLRLRLEAQMSWDDHTYPLAELEPVAVPLALDLEGAVVEDLDALERLPDLRELQLGHRSTEQLEELPQLESFASLNPCTPQDLRWIGRCRALRELDLCLADAAAGLDLSALAGLPLERLGLYRLDARPDWESIAGCPGLSELTLDASSGADAMDLGGLLLLPALRSLVVLRLRGALAALPAAVCERLTRLSAIDEGATWQSLARCPELEELHLRFGGAGQGALAALPKLRSLCLSYPRTALDLWALDGLALDRVELCQWSVPAGTVDAIGRMGSLRELSFEGALGEARRRLPVLRSLPGLQVLDLHLCDDLPAALRWRFEGREELALAFEGLARGQG